MTKEIICTSKAPAAVGPYSQAVKAGGLVFVSGQIPLDPATGALVEGDIQDMTRRVIENLEATLAASGASLSDVVKTTVFLLTMDNFAKMNEVYAEYFGDSPPARACVAVKGLPRGAEVEIEAVAII